MPTASRLPGKYTHAAALNKVHELEQDGKDAFVWIGLHEPDEHQMQAVADVFCLHELAVEDAGARPPAAEAGALRQDAVPGAQDRELRRTRVGRPWPARSSRPARS